ncbi:hypothetical protein EK21DRAFT_85647 [Setomelanomma holmii]|uniref:Uncharacterized protein n=1 Tax=Setomelanomma holmii TaxID=210430 RepID=A0A9P4HJ71_9PLEO|nr:hypothetical protein EK21DRAFT_85647 [Setomelanomma holmii]
MPLTHTQTGIIGASIASFIALSMLILLLFLRGRVPFTFSRSNPSSNSPLPTSTKQSFSRGILARKQSDSSSDMIEGEYEKYGELYVAPNQRPTVMALDIMMRSLLVTGLSGRAKKNDEPQSDGAVGAKVGEKEEENKTQRKTVRFQMEPERADNPHAEAETQIKDERRPLETREADEIAVDPMSFSFGSGKAMARLYRS